MPGIARVGDPLDGPGDRLIDPRDVVALVRRCYSGAALVAIEDDWTKAPSHDWEKLVTNLASRTFLNGKPVALVGSKDTGGHTVLSGATRTIIGV